MTPEAATSPAGADRHLVVAGLLVRDARVLLCHRAADRAWYPDVWDLPGGHIETGETSEEALIRELGEELGVAVPLSSASEFGRLQTSEFDCSLWVVSEWAGTPMNAAESEHDELGWWSGPEIDGLRLAHEDYPTLIARAFAFTGS